MFRGDEARIRQKAHEIWQAEGCPDGSSDRHWQMARELIAQQDNQAQTLRPNPAAEGADAARTDEPVEPLAAVEGQADVPGLDDQGEQARPYPTRDALRES